MEKTKSLVSKEREYRERIKAIRKMLFEKEMELENVVEEYVAFEFSIKSFYKNYYLQKLGSYIITLEDLKNKILGIEKLKKIDEDEKKEELKPFDEVKIKKIYRKLSRLYHPDKFKNLDEDEKKFYEFRMSEINEAFEKRDIKRLESILKKSEVELDNSGLSPLERIRYMEDDIYIISKMIEIYREKKKTLSSSEIALLMQKRPQEREELINEIKKRFLSEIEIYKRIARRLGC